MKQFGFYKEYEGYTLIHSPDKTLWAIETDGDSLDECLSNVQLQVTGPNGDEIAVHFNELQGEDLEKVKSDIIRIIKIQQEQDSKSSSTDLYE